MDVPRVTGAAGTTGSAAAIDWGAGVSSRTNPQRQVDTFVGTRRAHWGQFQISG